MISAGRPRFGWVRMVGSARRRTGLVGLKTQGWGLPIGAQFGLVIQGWGLPIGAQFGLVTHGWG
eukprot:5399867-Prymnesium_polylepis.1